MHDVDESESDESDVSDDEMTLSLLLATRSTGRIDTSTFKKLIHCKQMHPEKKIEKVIDKP